MSTLIELIKWKTKNITSSEHFQNSSRKTVERVKIDTSNIQIHERALF
jgi:hypothetical protein